MNVYQSVCANFEAQKPSWLSDKIAAGVGVMGLGAYFKDDRNFSTFFDPLWTQNDVIVTLHYDVIVTNTDRIWTTPPPP